MSFKQYIFILIVLFTIISSCSPRKKYPTANQGVIDLKSWDFETDGNIPLNGEWEFYWNQLLQPEDFRNDSLNQPTYTIVPKIWNNQSINGIKTGSNGYATYRLKVFTEGYNIFALQFHRVETAYKIWVNGNLISEIGTVAKSNDEMKAAWIPKEYIIDSKSRILDVVIQVSNFKHRKGGISNPILLGKPDKIDNASRNFISFDIFIIGVLLIMAFYHFGLYFLRRKDVFTIFFAFACVTTGIYTSVNGEFLLTRFFPDFNWELLVKINFITNYLRVMFFALFLYSLFPKDLSKKLTYATVIWATAMSLFVIVTPAKIFTQTIMIFIVGTVIFMAHFIIGSILAVSRNTKGSVLSFIGTLIMCLTATNDIFHDFEFINTMYLSTFGLFVFIFFQALMLAFRSTNSFNSVEKLTERLLSLDAIKNELLLVSSYDLGKILKILVDHFKMNRGIFLLTSYDRLYIYAEAFHNNEKIKIFEDLPDQQASEKNIQLYDKYAVEESIKQKRIYILDKISSGADKSNYLISKKLNSVWSLPLFDNNGIQAILYFENNEKVKNQEENTAILEIISSQLSTLVDNSKIYHQLESLNRHLEEIVEQRTAEVFQQKEEISAQRDEIEAKNQVLKNALFEIERKNRDITDSIRYASRIQESILPTNQFVKQIFPESFILFKPKDILSGDFYWFDHIFISETFGKAKKELKYAAAVDCTGHGVPGALMSLISNNLLNYALNELKITKPSEILNVLQQGLIMKLKAGDKSTISQDGMDLALIAYDTENHLIHFAGAKNPLILIRDGKIMIFEGDKFGIGDIHHTKSKKTLNYTDIEIPVFKGDCLFLFSDGFADQFGGEKGRKIMKSRLYKLFEENHYCTMEAYKQILESYFENWKGENQQLDDVLVIGIRL